MINDKRMKWIGLVIHHDELNSFDFLTDVIMQSLGYETTQAQTCAQIIQSRGSYVVKVYKGSEMAKARQYWQLFVDEGIPADLNPF